MCIKFKNIDTQSHAVEQHHAVSGNHIAASGIHAPCIPIPVNVKHTGASTDEPQLNMMREMTDGAREIAQFNLPFYGWHS
jgi:hypothetical protein